jgi:hypothetical protein
MSNPEFPDIPAGHYLAVEVVESRDRGIKRASRWGITVVEALVLHELLDPSESGDHRAVVQVSDRWSHDVVYVQDWGHDPGGATREKETIETDLARTDIETFLAEYSIEWSPPGLEAEEGED